MCVTTRVGRLATSLFVWAAAAGCSGDAAAPTAAVPVGAWHYRLPSTLAMHAAPRVWLPGEGAAAARDADDAEVGVERANAVANGLFEARLRGWTVVDQGGGSGSWFPQFGSQAPFSGLPHPAPADPPRALADQLGAGSHILYQDIAVPVRGGRLTFDLSVDNWAGEYHTPPTLDFTVVPNQQFRADIVSPAEPVETARILKRVFVTTWGMPSVFSTRVSSDLSAFAGQVIRLRFAEVDNLLFFNVGIDNVRVR